MKEPKVLGDVKSFTVNRRSWLRGTGEGMLLDDQNKKCCLGFYARECGLSAKDIRGLEAPER